MQYPLISEYVRAIQDASNNLDELAHLVPVQDDHGEPYRSSGAFAVVFKMKDEQTGKCYALKCFTEEQEGRAEAYRQIADELEFVDSSYITSVKYLDKEIFVDSSCEEDEFPVLLMDWIDGETMETYIAENYQDNYAMAMLCYRFCKMAAWLRSQPFAHGDIKPDNIMVRPDGTLTLVDYDGMFVSAMKGQKSPTIGTKDFSHPLRTVDDFDETIDDFALASIALSLKAISLKPSLLDEYGAADRLLFSAEDYRDLSKSKVLAALQELMNDEEVNTLLSMFLLAHAKKNICLLSNKYFLLERPIRSVDYSLSYVSDDDLDNHIVDNYGVCYSIDGKRLLYVEDDLEGSYEIRQGVEVICDNAFVTCYSMTNVEIPNSVVLIGKKAFLDCRSLKHIRIPSNVNNLGDSAFEDCESLCSLEIASNNISLGTGVFSGCSSLLEIEIHGGINKMIGNPFSQWNGKLKLKTNKFSLEHDVLYNRTKSEIIAFLSCSKEFIMPSSVIRIAKNAFYKSKISKIQFSSNLATIGDYAFYFCKNLSRIDLPNSLIEIGDDAFSDCTNLNRVDLPNSLMKIGANAFSFTSCQIGTIFVSTLKYVGKGAFCACELNSEARKNLSKNFGQEVFVYDGEVWTTSSQEISLGEI